MMYEIIETMDKGKVMIATQDMLPGTEVVQEEAIMCLPQSYIDPYKGHVPPGILEDIVAAVSFFKKHLSKQEQIQYLQLFGPTEGIKTQSFYKIANNLVHANEETGESGAPFTAEEQQEFVRIGNIYNLNAFGNDEGNRLVFNDVSRMSHSCIPNCHADLGFKSCVVRVVTPVKAGEELTVEYNNKYCLKSTAFRRWRYQETKGFTCHCPRCSAAGDDTRQFNCFDSACKGRHYVSQALSEIPLTELGDHYTEDVHYVPPYLLPCTVCQCNPPLQYQTDMLALETQLTTKYEELKQRSLLFQIPRINSGPQLLNLMHDIQQLTPPPWHSLTILYTNLLYKVQDYYMLINSITGSSSYGPQLPILPILALEHALEVEEAILAYPNMHLFDTLSSVAKAQYRWSPPQEALATYRRALRMHALLYGREQRFVLGDKHTAELIQKLPSPEVANTHHCAFCQERPEAVAIKLSQCGACGQVLYCSRGCQKAHWPVHKQQCKKVAK